MVRPVVRFVAALLAVLLVAEVGFRALDGRFAEPVTWYHEIAQAKVEHLEGIDEPLDLVFTGTSQSYHGIDPRVVDAHLGTRSYNAGIPAGIPPVQRRWLFDAVLPEVEVDTVVWAMSSVDLNDARPQSVIDLYDTALETRRGVLADADRWLSERSALFRHRRSFADPQAWVDDDDPVDRARRVLHSSGKRRPGSPNLSDRERQRIRRDVVGDFRVGGRMVDLVAETVRELQARDIDVVLVWLPEAPRFAELLPDRSMQREAKREADRLARRLGVALVDVSRGYRNRDFIDFTHLDGDAADRLSAELARRLAETPGLV